MATTPIAWQAAFDPSEIKDYTHSFAAEMIATEDAISSSIFILPQDAIAAGVVIESQVMTSVGGLVFFSIAPGSQTAGAFEGDGTRYRIRHQVTTALGRTLERSIYLTVKQL